MHIHIMTELSPVLVHGIDVNVRNCTGQIIRKTVVPATLLRKVKIATFYEVQQSFTGYS